MTVTMCPDPDVSFVIVVADPKVVHRLGVALVSLLTIAVSLVAFLGHCTLIASDLSCG